MITFATDEDIDGAVRLVLKDTHHLAGGAIGKLRDLSGAA